jgi:hypothetical protein
MSRRFSLRSLLSPISSKKTTSNVTEDKDSYVMTCLLFKHLLCVDCIVFLVEIFLIDVNRLNDIVIGFF